MRTTIDINDRLLKEAMHLSHASTKKKTIELSLEVFIRQKQVEQLAKRLGTGTLNLTQAQLKSMRSR